MDIQDRHDSVSSSNQPIAIRIRNIARVSIASPLLWLSICLFFIPVLLSISAVAGWFVWKNVPSGFRVPVHLQYGDDRPPYADIELPSFTTAQPYDIYLRLVVPAATANYELGNFMSTLILSSFENETLASVRHPHIILPQSYGFFSSLWFQSSKLLELRLPLIDSFVTSVPRLKAHIELGRRDSWRSIGRGEGRELTVVSAALYADIRPRGLLGILSRFPFTVLFISSSTFFFLSFLVLCVFIIRSIQWSPKALTPLFWKEESNEETKPPSNASTSQEQNVNPDTDTVRRRIRTLSDTLTDNPI